MGKTVVAEESVRQYTNDLIADKEFAVGLVLGQNTSQHDHVIHLAKTPLQDEGAEKPVPKMPKSVEDWDASLIALHAKQVTRMLLGGFSVLGLFVCTPTDALQTNALAALKRMLIEIRKTLTKSHHRATPEETDHLLLHVSCATSKVVCKTMDISSSLVGTKSADFKFQSSPVKWNFLRCRMAIDLLISVSKEDADQSLIQQIKNGLRPFCEAVWHATPVINGTLRNEEEWLDVGDAKAKRGKQMELVTPAYKVDLLLELRPDAKCKIIEADCSASVQVRGTIEGRTFVAGKPTISTAVQCLKQDIVRSLISRCEVHCEDLLVIDEEQQDRIVVHELPCRIFAPLPTLGLSLSDYIFPGESADNSLSAFQELLGICVSAEDVEINCERLPDSSDLQTPSQKNEFDGPTLKHVSHQGSPESCNYTFLGLSIAIACIAGGTSYYLLN